MDDDLRALERALAAREDPELRLALAERCLELGLADRAARIILPIACDPRSAPVVLALSSSPDEQDNLVDRLAQKLFFHTDDLALRHAYLRTRMPGPAADILCDLATECANERAYLSKDNSRFFIAPHNGQIVTRQDDGSVNMIPITLTDAWKESVDAISLFLPAYHRLINAAVWGLPQQGMLQCERVSAVTRDDEYVHFHQYSAGFILLDGSGKPEQLIVLRASPYAEYAHLPEQAGPMSTRTGPHAVILFEPDSVRSQVN